MRAVVVVMAKAPRMGLAKTRLARRIGPARAWRVNRALHALTLRAAVDSRWTTLLAVAPARDVAGGFGGLWPRRVARAVQAAGDLGARLAALAAALRPGPALFIGTDCPGLRRGDLWDAVKTLRRAEAVVGPATDGGYWLLGLRGRALARPPFGAVRWSGPHALADTLAALPAGVRVVRLRTLSDLD